MKKLFIVISALMLLLSLAACANPSPSESDETIVDLHTALEKVQESYDRDRCFYDYGPEDPEWTQNPTAAAHRRALHLDESVFTDLPTEEVLRAVMEYPLIGDLMAFDTSQMAVEKVAQHCTALKVLMQRPDALAVVEEAEKDVYAYTGKVEAPTDSKYLFPRYLSILHAALEQEK